MKTLESFLEELQGISKEEFVKKFPTPFLLSRSIEEKKQQELDEETDLVEVFRTEDVDFDTLKFDTDDLKPDEALKIQEGCEEVWIVPLAKSLESSKQMITVGRTGNNDIYLPFPGISKFHAYFLVSAKETFVVDGDSKNGTFVNGKRLLPYQKYKLSNLDTVSFALLLHFFFFTSERLFDYLTHHRLL